MLIKHCCNFLLISFIFASLSISTFAQDEEGWIDLFNGTDLSGWTQKNGTATYEIEEGGIICGTTVDGSPNSFLCSDREFGNFELTFETKISDELNSGVQIRSKTKELNANEEKRGDKFGRVYGPQVEVEASGENGAQAGYVYGEATGRGWLTPEDSRAPRKVFRDSQWNTYRIIAYGARIQTYINGELMGDLTHEEIFESHPSGFIGLQVHSIGRDSGPFQARWRNIRIRELEADAAAAKVAHSFVAAGKANGIVVVGEGGEIEWQMQVGASDVWMLENGNVLAALYPSKQFPSGAVAEIDRKTNEFVWTFKGREKEISTVQMIGDDQYLVAELGDSPKAIVINRAGDVLSETTLKCQTSNAHMETRMLRLLPNGNYIAPHLLDFAVKEYAPDTGEVVNTIATDDRGREKRDWPFTAIRLENGNTVISCTNGNRVIEVDTDGAIVWSVDNEDIGEELLADPCGAQRLPNGNTVIASYASNGSGKVKLLEVTRDKKVVWRFEGLDYGIHHFQILTTNGKPLSAAWK